jgi:thioredoxin 1
MSREPSASTEPSREEVDQFVGATVLEFGSEWCGYCQALRPDLTALLDAFPQVRHLRIEDGRGRPLGRSFRVKLWPTLVFLKDGAVVRRLVRPAPAEVREALKAVVL